MAKFVPIAPTDASLPLFDALSAYFRGYVVTWFTPASQRAIFGVAKNLGKAFQLCRSAKLRNPLAHAACYLIVGTAYYFVDDGGEFHP